MRRHFAALLFALLGAHAATAAPLNDDEIRGYAAAVLQREFSVEPDAVRVSDGVVFVEADLSETQRAKLIDILRSIDGVARVEFRAVDTRAVGWTWLPLHSQFKPLLADPRWPHFAGAYQYYYEGPDVTNAGSADLGETFALARYSFDGIGTVELALQAGVFALFDLAAPSTDLVNADYLAGLPLTFARGNFSAMARLQHQSSHLGDEFVLRTQIDRVNLSYEQFDLLFSYEFSPEVRVYGGGGYIFRAEPSSLHPWSTQFGIEYVRRDEVLPLHIKPLIALDIQNHEQGGWTANVSLRAGVQFGKPLGVGRNLQVLIEFYNGKSPNGQFYDDHVGYVGPSVHLYF